ncbi:phosphonate utilization associated transcriptional regulator [compost metagenome]
MATKKTPKITSIETPVPMYEQVYQQIVQALMAGHFEPGQKLTYRRVAEQFGTSPMPVRTAFQRLQALKGLELLPNGSVEVPLLTVKSFVSLTEARIAIEGTATELAATRLNGNNLRTVRHHCNQRTAAAKAGDIDRYLQANFDFKFSIYRHCGNEHLIYIIEMLWLQARPLPTISAMPQTTCSNTRSSSRTRTYGRPYKRTGFRSRLP